MSKSMAMLGVEQSKIQAIIKIAENIVLKNRIIEIEDLFKRAKRELDTNSRETLLIIKHLFKEKFFVEGSKLIKQELLKNPYRAAIYKFIKEFPGINFLAIKKYAFNNKNLKDILSVNPEDLEYKSSGQFIWHIEVLTKFNCIKKVNYKKFSLFMPTDMNPEIGILYFLLRNKNNYKLFKYLFEDDSINQSDIPKIAGIAKDNVYYRIKTLKEENLISSEKVGRSSVIKINPDKKSILMKIHDNISAILLKKPLKKKKTSKLSDSTPIQSQAEKDELKKIESEVDIKRESFLCLVHKGQVEGDNVYICPQCKSFYCIRCAKTLKEKGEKCWSCEYEIKIK